MPMLNRFKAQNSWMDQLRSKQTRKHSCWLFASEALSLPDSIPNHGRKPLASVLLWLKVQSIRHPQFEKYKSHTRLRFVYCARWAAT